MSAVHPEPATPISGALPVEIIDTILSYFAHDDPTLRNCAKVSRAWLLCANRLASRIVCLRPATMHRFLSLTTNVHETITTNVKDVRLRDQKDLSLWDAANLYTALSSFNKVSNLTFISCDAPSMRIMGLTTVRILSHVTRLSFREVVFASLIDLVSIISACSILESLSIIRSSWPPLDDADQAFLNLKSSPPLRRLHLDECPKHGLLCWLLDRAPHMFPPIEDITVTGIHFTEKNSVINYCLILGSNLKRLAMGFHKPEDGTSWRDYSNDDFAITAAARKHLPSLLNAPPNQCAAFVLFERLEHFELVDFLFHGDPTKSCAVTWAPRVLQAVNSPFLTTVVLGVVLDTFLEFGVHQVDWRDLDSVFQKPSFAQLKQVSFRVQGQINQDSLECLLQTLLPRCRDRGILTTR